MRVFGGLGNQQFQLAYGLYLTKKYKGQLVLDTSYFLKRYHPFKEQGFLYPEKLSLFSNSFVFTQKWEKELIGTIFYFGKVSRILAKLMRYFSFMPHICIGKDSFSIIEGRRNYIQGFFQNESLIDEVRTNMVKILTEKFVIAECHQSTLKKMSSCCSVSLHIRRGDYINGKSSIVNNFASVSLDYYIKSLSVINASEPIERVFVFSDDIAWAKKNLNSQFKIEFVDYVSDANADVVEQFLMRSCKHNIIANSTYSWMSAWLNTNDKKIVCCPKKWFSDIKRKNDIYIPKSWIRIPN
jgi:hypothetical protein